MKFDLENEGEEMTFLIKNASFFPFRTGNLKNHATKGTMINATTYCIHFDSLVAPYVEYLEEGTKPSFRISKKGNMFYHPGSTKHQGFIKNKSVGAIVRYIESKFNGVTIEL